jgi:hypothetical protein
MELFFDGGFGLAVVWEPLGALPRKHLDFGSFNITPFSIASTNELHEHIHFLYYSQPK